MAAAERALPDHWRGVPPGARAAHRGQPPILWPAVYKGDPTRYPNRYFWNTNSPAVRAWLATLVAASARDGRVFVDNAAVQPAMRPFLPSDDPVEAYAGHLADIFRRSAVPWIIANCGSPERDDDHWRMARALAASDTISGVMFERTWTQRREPDDPQRLHDHIAELRRAGVIALLQELIVPGPDIPPARVQTRVDQLARRAVLYANLVGVRGTCLWIRQSHVAVQPRRPWHDLVLTGEGPLERHGLIYRREFAEGVITLDTRKPWLTGIALRRGD
jgi:hypothetical protein